MLCFFLVVFVLFWGGRSPKRPFPSVLEVFPLLFPKRPVFKILLFFLFCVCFPCSRFVFSFKIPFFFAFCPSTPFWKTFLFFGFFYFFALSFGKCLLVSLKQTFLTSSFSKSTCFQFWQFIFFLLLLFLFSCFMFLLSVLCWHCFWYVFLMLLFCFCFVSCFAFRL